MVVWPLEVFETGTSIYLELHYFESSFVYILALELKDNLETVSVYCHSHQFAAETKKQWF